GAATDDQRRQRAVQRLERASIALELLGGLGEQGWKVEPAFAAARSGLRQAETFPAALRLLAAMPVPDAQRALLDLAVTPELSGAIREGAVIALQQSVTRHGVMLATSHRWEVLSMYNADTVDDDPVGRAITALLTPSPR
ncbi:MAG: hypothetical protein EBZ13_04600, partial [Planctomycetia bacterium]|nr:hypothetical protein [Planctomycetia bacterium]